VDTSSLPPGILIRPIEPEDLERLEQFYAGLSPDSLQARFHGAVRGVGEPAARTFCGPDHLHREGLVAVWDGPGDEDPIVAHVCLEPTGSGDLELAVAVADGWQRHGIGRAIVEVAIRWAETHGFERVRASVRWSNPAILALLRSIGRPMTLASPSNDGCLEAIIGVGREVPAAA
jgi:acetyltransferase